MTWSHRYIGTPVISMLLRMFTGLKGCRYPGRPAVVSPRRPQPRNCCTRTAWSSHPKCCSRRPAGLNVTDVPITYGERLGETHAQHLRDGWRHLRFHSCWPANYLFTMPGIALTILIATLGYTLLSNSIEIGEMTWQPVFMAASALSGRQRDPSGLHVTLVRSDAP